jgi:hypothetical protein
LAVAEDIFETMKVNGEIARELVLFITKGKKEHVAIA